MRRGRDGWKGVVLSADGRMVVERERVSGVVKGQREKGYTRRGVYQEEKVRELSKGKKNA